jgi:hypothetical protein
MRVTKVQSRLYRLRRQLNEQRQQRKQILTQTQRLRCRVCNVLVLDSFEMRAGCRRGGHGNPGEDKQ